MYFVKTWRYNGGDTSFFFPKFLFIWGNFSCYIYQYLRNGLEPERVSDFVINCFWNGHKSERKETKKIHNFTQIFFHSQIFVNLETDFSIKFTYCQKFEGCCNNVVTPGLLCDMFYSWIQLSCPKLGRSWVIPALQIPILRD